MQKTCLHAVNFDNMTVVVSLSLPFFMPLPLHLGPETYGSSALQLGDDQRALRRLGRGGGAFGLGGVPGGGSLGEHRAGAEAGAGQEAGSS